MDKTPLYFDIPGSHMVRKKEARCACKSTGPEKHRLIVIFAIAAAGDMFTPKRAMKDLHIPPGGPANGME